MPTPTRFVRNFSWRYVLLNCCQIISDSKIDLEIFFFFELKVVKDNIYVCVFRIMCLLLLLLLFITGPCQTKLLMLSSNSAAPEHKSNPMSLMVWMCNWTLKLKVTVLVFIMKLKESCPLLLNNVPWVRIC